MGKGLRPPPREWLREQIRAGRSRAELADEWGQRSGQAVSAAQIGVWCRRYGIFGARSAPSPRKLPPPAREWLAARLDQTLQEIATAAGTSPNVVSRWLAELGLTRTYRGTPTQARIMGIIAPGGTAAEARAWLTERATTPAVEIAAELGASYQVVHPLMEAFGVAYEPVRRPRPKGQGSVYERWAAGEEWAQRDCPRCPYQAECRRLEPTGRPLRCETGSVEYERAFEGKERVTA